MQVSEVMSSNVKIADPDESVQDAARKMLSDGIGYLPVGSGDKLVGTLTDRDIVTRVIVEGRDPSVRVGEIMTRDVKYCFDDEDIDQIVANMGELQVRSLPVVNRSKRLVGVISLSDAPRSLSGQGRGNNPRRSAFEATIQEARSPAASVANTTGRVSSRTIQED
ncbi:CBS domain-containing protein [Fodinicurvata sp. EGI_FJ10296]|uniref:CBS domain-containing protein n=1 Tax=Fodinicurvata sp. EGI_FJ10296 TaxID=3231908 RepID=UPI003451A96E